MNEADAKTAGTAEQPLGQPVPVLLQVLAWLWILEGLTAVVTIIVKLTQHQVHFDVGVLGLLIGIGLLKLRRGWWVCAIVIQILALGIAVVVGAIAMQATSQPTFNIFGQSVSYAPWWLFHWIIAIAIGATVIELLLHFMPSVRRSVNASEEAKRRRYCSRPWLAGLIVMLIVGASIGGMFYGYQVAEDFYVWKLPSVSMSDRSLVHRGLGWSDRSPYGQSESWKSSWQWKTERFMDKPSTDPRHFDLFVIARLDGEAVAKARLLITYAYLRNGTDVEVDAYQWATFLCLEDRSPTSTNRYSIVTTSRFDRFQGDVTFHLITEGGGQAHKVAPPSEYFDGASGGVLRSTSSCPSAMVHWSWVAGPIADKNQGVANISSIHVAKVSTGPITFNETGDPQQPIKWEIRLLRPENSPHPEQRAVIPAGARDGEISLWNQQVDDQQPEEAE
jgi:hypothetical protein